MKTFNPIKRLTLMVSTLALVGVPLLASMPALAAVDPIGGEPPTITTCQPGRRILGFPTWYQYLQGEQISRADGTIIVRCNPKLNEIADALPILLAVVEIMLRIVGLAAVGYVIFGGFKYLTSQGEPDRAKDARSTIINALIGMVVAILATAIVAFVGRSLIK